LNYESILCALPQTQCTQCGYEGCAPYAAAIVAGETDINRCPPGGDAGVALLAQLTGIAIKPITAECGITKPRHIAVIDPARCIGCTLCIVACPVDAIVGAPKAMHQVIKAACTGCDLCLPPCPVDCIEMVRIDGLLDWTLNDAALARAAHEARNARLQKEYSTQEQRNRQAIAAASPVQVLPASVDAASKQAAIADALAKARTRRAAI
jgi:electron transport complex protein RnfB